MPDSISVTPLDGAPFGGRVNFDDPAGLTEADDAVLQVAFDRYHLLVLKGLSLDYEQQFALVNRILPAIRQPERGIVSNVVPQGILGSGELEWHSDILFTPKPYRGITLYGLDVQPGGSSTHYANAVAAYAAMPASLRARVDGLRAMSVGQKFRDTKDYQSAVAQNIPHAVHPLVTKHPSTGEGMIFADRLHTVRVLEVDEATSDRLLDDVFEVFYAPENIYTHWWYPRDLVIWDNLALQHSRGALDPTVPRTLQRVILGEASLEQLVPEYEYVGNNN